MRGIYLAAFKANHPGHDIVYQDINGQRDLGGDMMDINLDEYDYIIATPPCNWWSRANWRRNTSEYSLKTKHLLPDILERLSTLGKPFIVENVKNDKFFKEHGLYDYPFYVYKIGRHTYWTNIPFKHDDIIQIPKIDYKNGKKRFMSSQNLGRAARQGTQEVHEVIERWLEEIEKERIR